MIARPPLPPNLWDRLPPEGQALILGLRREVAELQAKVQALQQEVDDLHHRLNQNSTNSSRPPSTDRPNLKCRPPRAPCGRLRGGQPGHGRQQRPL
jgi:transposase